MMTRSPSSKLGTVDCEEPFDVWYGLERTRAFFGCSLVIPNAHKVCVCDLLPRVTCSSENVIPFISFIIFQDGLVAVAE